MSEPTTEAGKRLLVMLDERHGRWSAKAFDAVLVRRVCEEFVPKVEAEARADLARRIEDRLRDALIQSELTQAKVYDRAISIVREEAGS